MSAMPRMAGSRLPDDSAHQSQHLLAGWKTPELSPFGWSGSLLEELGQALYPDSSPRSQAPVGHSLGLSMVTASAGYQRARPRSWTSNCPLLLLTAITCAIPHFTRVHG